MGIRATAQVFEVDANTVLHWLIDAAEQLRAFSAYFLCDLHVKQLQLDELYAVLRDLKTGEISEDEAFQYLGPTGSSQPTSSFPMCASSALTPGGMWVTVTIS